MQAQEHMAIGWAQTGVRAKVLHMGIISRLLGCNAVKIFPKNCANTKGFQREEYAGGRCWRAVRPPRNHAFFSGMAMLTVLELSHYFCTSVLAKCQTVEVCVR